MARMIRPREEFEVPRIIVGPIVVLMMDVEPVGDIASIGEFPNFTVQTHAVPLKILPA